MKIILYGFKPFGQYKNNISESIVRHIKKRPSLTKIIFPVRFNKNQFLKKIREIKPDVIIGLGQYPRGQKIRIERKACNLQSDHQKTRPISQGRPTFVFLNLKFKKDRYSRYSYRAGQYVCNYSMYLVSTHVQSKGVRFAFLHIPVKIKLDTAIRFVENQINNIIKETT